MPKLRIRRERKPFWQRPNGEFYSICRDCGTEVKGEEKLKLGGAGWQGGRDIHFHCPKCGAHWWKDKATLINAIKGGYQNVLGDWIPCDERGRPLTRPKIKI